METPQSQLHSHPKVQCQVVEKRLAPLFNENFGSSILCRSIAEPSFVMLDCTSGLLSAGVDKGSVKGQDVTLIDLYEYPQGVLHFEVHPRMSAGSLNELMKEISPLAQQVVDGYNSEFAADCVETKAAQIRIAEICRQAGENPKNLDQVCPVEDLIDGKALLDVWPSGSTVEEAARNLISKVDQKNVRLLGSASDLAESLLKIAEKDIRENGAKSLSPAHRGSLVAHGHVEPEDLDVEEEEKKKSRRRPRM